MTPSEGAASSEGASQAPRIVRPPTLPDAVLRRLRLELIQGRFKPGDQIGLDQFAEELGVSAIPVREALRVLAAEGRVEYLPHRGYRVTTLSYEDIEEIFLICRLLEGEALRRGVVGLDDAAIERMADLLAELERTRVGAGVEESRQWEAVRTHQEFHFVPYENAGLPRLVEQLRRLWDHTDHYATLSFFADEVAARAMNAEHRELYEACEARDAMRAVKLMDSHRDHVLERTRRTLAAKAARELA